MQTARSAIYPRQACHLRSRPTTPFCLSAAPSRKAKAREFRTRDDIFDELWEIQIEIYVKTIGPGEASKQATLGCACLNTCFRLIACFGPQVKGSRLQRETAKAIDNRKANAPMRDGASSLFEYGQVNII